MVSQRQLPGSGWQLAQRRTSSSPREVKERQRTQPSVTPNNGSSGETGDGSLKLTEGTSEDHNLDQDLPEAYRMDPGKLPHNHGDLEERFPRAVACAELADKDIESGDKIEAYGEELGSSPDPKFVTKRRRIAEQNRALQQEIPCANRSSANKVHVANRSRPLDNTGTRECSPGVALCHLMMTVEGNKRPLCSAARQVGERPRPPLQRSSAGTEKGVCYDAVSVP